MKYFLIPISLLTLVALDIYALELIEKNFGGITIYAWLVVIFSAIIYGIFMLRYLFPYRK